MSKGWLLLAAGLAACSSESGSEHARAQDLRTTATSRPYAGEEALRVELQYGAGRLEIRPADEGTLYRATTRYDASVMSPRTSFSDGVLRVSMEGNGHRSVARDNWKGNDLKLELGPRAPLDLDLRFGAAEAALELGGLRIQRATIQTGASDTKVRFSEPNLERCRSLRLQVGVGDFGIYQIGNLSPEHLQVEGGVGDLTLDFGGEWKNDISGSLRMGIGSLTLALPRDVGVRISKRAFLADFEPAGLVKHGNTFVSPGYDTAKRHLDLDVEAALGSFEVRWLDGRAAAL